jgi:hypothetical protein
MAGAPPATLAARSRWGVAPDALLPWLCVLALGLRDIALAVAYIRPDGDRYWQLWLGERILRAHTIPRSLGTETFSSAGASWTPQEWLLSLGLAWSREIGVPWLLPAVCGAAAMLALAAVAWRAQRRSAPPIAVSIVVVLTGLAMLQSFGVRAQVFGWTGLALVLCCLELRGRLLWAAVPITVIWANLHASVLLAPAVCAMYALGTLIEQRAFTADVRRFGLLAAACAAAVCATPLGLELPRYTIALMGSPIRQWIDEWGHTDIGSAAFAVGALPLLLVFAVRGGRATVTDRIAIVAFAILLFSAVRNVPVFAIVVAPIAASVLGLSAPSARRTTSERIASMITVAAAAVVVVSLPLLSLKSAAPSDPLPLGAATMLEATHRGSRVFCEDLAWCSVFLGDRSTRVFMDGRCDPYPLPVWRDYIAVIGGNPVWSAVLDRWRVDAILVRPAGALDALLIAEPDEWAYVGSDRRARVYVRR